MSVFSPRAGSSLPTTGLPTTAVPIAALLAVASLSACSGNSTVTPEPSRGASTSAASPSPAASTTSPDLDSYTDPGDACAQAISAISYADDALRPLGQEPYQEFNDVVRSRLAAVAGTLALEAKDWPDEPVHRQASLVQPLAQEAGALLPDQSAASKAARINVLLRYRIAAGTLILVCRDAAPPSPSP